MRCFRMPQEGELSKPYTTTDLFNYLQKHYPAAMRGVTPNRLADDGCIGDTACSYRVWQCVPAGEAEGFFRGLKLFPGVIFQPERPPAKGLRER